MSDGRHTGLARPGAVTKAVVLVAGFGTRLLPAAKAQPKEMLPVGRKPCVQYVVEEMKAAGIRVSPNPAALGTTMVELLSGK